MKTPKAPETILESLEEVEGVGVKAAGGCFLKLSRGVAEGGNELEPSPRRRCKNMFVSCWVRRQRWSLRRVGVLETIAECLEREDERG